LRCIDYTELGCTRQPPAARRDASNERGYGLDLAEVERVWMAGCVIRAKLLGPIRTAFLESPDLPYLILAEPFRTT